MGEVGAGGPVRQGGGGAGVLHRPGVPFLVGAGDRGRHDDRRSAGGGEFGAGDRPAAGDDQSGGAEGGRHVVEVGDDSGGQSGFPVGGLDRGGVGGAGLVGEGEAARLGGESGQGLHDGPVQPGGALAAAGDEHREGVAVPLFRGRHAEEVRAHRDAGVEDPPAPPVAGEVARPVLEADGDLGGEGGAPAGGEAGVGVRLQEQRGHPGEPGGEGGDPGNGSAGAEERRRAELAQQSEHRPQRPRQLQPGAGQLPRRSAPERRDGHQVERETVRRHQPGLHAPRVADEADGRGVLGAPRRVPGLLEVGEGPGHGEARVDVAAAAGGGDQQAAGRGLGHRRFASRR